METVAAKLLLVPLDPASVLVTGTLGTLVKPFDSQDPYLYGRDNSPGLRSHGKNYPGETLSLSEPSHHFVCAPMTPLGAGSFVCLIFLLLVSKTKKFEHTSFIPPANLENNLENNG